MSDREAGRVSVTETGHSGHAFFDSRVTIIILVVACVSIASLLYGIRTISEDSERPATAERSEAMIVTKQDPAANRAIPPIDVSAPAKTETATFALG